MAKVIITQALRQEIEKKFKRESVEIFTLINELVEHPKKGKPVGVVGSIVIKELKYKKFRFYFVANRYKIKFLKINELQDTLIKFVRMSEKKDQQKVIEEIKQFLKQDTTGVL